MYHEQDSLSTQLIPFPSIPCGQEQPRDGFLVNGWYVRHFQAWSTGIPLAGWREDTLGCLVGKMVESPSVCPSYAMEEGHSTHLLTLPVPSWEQEKRLLLHVRLHNIWEIKTL